jgi:hypothetical protein
MNKLVRLPNGDWVAPDRISSIEALANAEVMCVPSVVVRTKDGARIIIPANSDESFELAAAEKLRDEIVKMIEECDSPF